MAKYIRDGLAAADALHQIGLSEAVIVSGKKDHKELLSAYSTISSFNDDTWEIDKKETDMNFPAATRRLDFRRLTETLKPSIKEWALDRLLEGSKLKGLQDRLKMIILCLQDIEEGKSLYEIDAKDIMHIHDRLFAGKCSPSTASSRWNGLCHFFDTMDCSGQMIIMKTYVTPPISKRMLETKYITDVVAVQLDILFMDAEKIPLAYRCIYWTIRLWPNRIEEVLSIKTDALKRLSEDEYILSVPVNKTGGNFDEPEEKLILIDSSSKIGKMYIDLIVKQVQIAKESGSRFLFVSKKICYMKKRQCYIEQGKAISLINENKAYFFFSRIGYNLGIVDAEGKNINLSTHKFRHNASSDRINSGIFQPIDVMYETGHKNTQMLDKNYVHREKPERRRPEFRGHITDDQKRLEMILKRPYAKEIYHLGICRDIRECGANRLACLVCGHLEIDKDALPFMKRDRDDWEQKRLRAEAIGNDSFAKVCKEWVSAYDLAFIRLEKEASDGKEKSQSSNAGNV